MWVVPLFLKLGVSVENEHEAIHVRTLTESAAMAASRSGNADREKPTFKDFQCQVGDRNVSDAEANRNKYCAIIPNP